MDNDYKDVFGNDGISESYLNPEIKTEDGLLARIFDEYQQIRVVDGVDFDKLIADVENGNYKVKADNISNIVTDCRTRSGQMLWDKPQLLDSLGASVENYHTFYDLWAESDNLVMNITESFDPAMQAIDDLETAVGKLAYWQKEYDRLAAEERAIERKRYKNDWSEVRSKYWERQKIYNQYILPLKKEIKRLLGEIEKYEQSIVEVSNKLTISENYYPGN